MRIRMRRVVCASLFACGSALPPAVAGAQPQPGGVPNLLAAVRPDQDVDVVTREGRLVRGHLDEVTPAVLILEGRRGPEEIPLASVREVWSPGGAHYLGFATAGALTGLGLGLLAIAGQGDCGDPTSPCATDGATTGGDIAMATAIGAGVGAATAWWKRHPRHLLYVGGTDPGASRAAVAAGLTVAADDEPGWVAISDLQGSFIEVSASGPRSTLQGALVAVGPGSLTLLVEGEPYVVPRAAVEKVWREPRIGWWSAGIATVLYGALLGGITAAFACPSEGDAWTSCDDRAVGISTAVVGGLLTARTLHQRREALAYDARHPRRAASGRLAVQPLLGRHAVGVRGSVTF